MIRNDPGKKNRIPVKIRWTALAAFAALSGMLSACAGGGPNQSWAGLAFDGDLAYLAHNSFITAIHLSSGQKAWQYPEKADSKVLYYADPLIDSNGDLVAGAYNGSVVKLDSATGTVKWVLEGDGEKIVAPVAEGPSGAYYASSESGDLLVIDPASGAIQRRIPLGKTTSWGPMAVNDERIYVATIEHKVLAVDAGEGTIAWTVDLGASIAGGVNLVDGKLVVGTFADKIIALSAENGETLWEADADGWVWQAPVIADGTIFATDLGGVLRALGLEDGAMVWRADLTDPIQAGPAVEGDTIYVGNASGKVRAYSTADGIQIWEQTIEGGIYGRLRVADGRLLAVVNGGKYLLAALSPDSGSILWTFDENA
jgi:outer membrane protein assembly factor BamB